MEEFVDKINSQMARCINLDTDFEFIEVVQGVTNTWLWLADSSCPCKPDIENQTLRAGLEIDIESRVMISIYSILSKITYIRRKIKKIKKFSCWSQDRSQGPKAFFYFSVLAASRCTTSRPSCFSFSAVTLGPSRLHHTRDPPIMGIPYFTHTNQKD